MSVRFVTNHAGIASLTMPGGMVYSWVRRFNDTVATVARRNAPFGTGQLRGQISAAPPRGGVSVTEGHVYSHAEHSLWVHEGTTGPIRANSGGVMPIHNRTRTAVVAYRETVRGQRPQPFLARALRTTFVRRGLHR